MATQVSTKRVAASDDAPKLGRNATFYVKTILPKNVGGKRKANEIVKKATALALKRKDKLVRVEYVFVAEGRASEREFGSTKMEAMRREVVNLRTPRKSRVKAKAAPTPRKRVIRKKANAASVKKSSAGRKSSAGKRSGSGRAAGRQSAKSK